MGMLPAGMGKQLITETRMVPRTVMGRHKGREGKAVMPFTEGHHALHGLFLAWGRQPPLPLAVRRDDRCWAARGSRWRQPVPKGGATCPAGAAGVHRPAVHPQGPEHAAT